VKPMAVSLCAVSLALPALGVVSLYGHRRVALPTYDKPVTFFTEDRQALALGPLPAGAGGPSAAACAGCHAKEHAEWHASAHARSVTEPVFTAAFAAEPRFVCRSCHSPLLEQHPRLLDRRARTPRLVAVAARANPHYDAALATEGVTCVTCHVRDGTVLTAKPTAPADVPHPLSYTPMLRKAEFCAGCHQFNIANPRMHPFERQPAPDPGRVSVSHAILQLRSGVVSPGAPGAPNGPPNDPSTQEEPPVPPQPGLDHQYQHEPREQQTLREFHLSSAAARGASCQSCHMPVLDGRRQHTWPGRSDPAMLRQAVSMSARLDRTVYREGDTLQAVIRLRNDTGHRFPTGDSLHAGILDVWLRNGDQTIGRQVSVLSNQRENNLVQLFMGNRMVRVRPDDRAFGEARLEAPSRADSRLLPGEEAMLVYRQPVTRAMANCRKLTLRVRLFHSAVHPGFRGGRIDPGVNTLRLIREQTLPVQTDRVSDPPARPAGPSLEASAPFSAASAPFFAGSLWPASRRLAGTRPTSRRLAGTRPARPQARG
jgi:hypothetical protein